MGELAGLHIIVTRPQAQAEAWAESLVEAGASVSLLPLMAIVPVQDEAHIRAIKNCILDFDVYQKAIFVSQNAVEQGFAWLENYWPQLPMGIEYFAVGETTAKLLQSYGVIVADLAQAQEGSMTSETLLQSPHLQRVAGERIIIFRGLGGRPHIGETLVERGARVDYCELYQRSLPSGAAAQAAQLLRETTAQQTIISLHSGEAFTNLLSVLEQADVGETVRQQLGLLVPSERVAEQAAAAGFGKIYTAENATDKCMLQRLTSINLTNKGHNCE